MKPENPTKVELVATYQQAMRLMMECWEYDADEASNSAYELVGYWFESSASGQPAGDLKRLNNGAAHCALSLAASRLHPHYDVDVWVDEQGTFWADQDIFC